MLLCILNRYNTCFPLNALKGVFFVCFFLRPVFSRTELGKSCSRLTFNRKEAEDQGDCLCEG